jgi:hypothetical protein
MQKKGNVAVGIIIGIILAIVAGVIILKLFNFDLIAKLDSLIASVVK